MTSLEEKLVSIVEDIDLGTINEIKKLSLLDEIGDVLTHRILARLINEVAQDKREIFIKKIKEHKSEPEKVLLFIDHFIEDADKIIDEEIDKYKKDLRQALQKS